MKECLGCSVVTASSSLLHAALIIVFLRLRNLVDVVLVGSFLAFDGRQVFANLKIVVLAVSTKNDRCFLYSSLAMTFVTRGPEPGLHRVHVNGASAASTTRSLVTRVWFMTCMCFWPTKRTFALDEQSRFVPMF